MTVATARPGRGDQTVRVLLGTERFSSKRSWSELTALMPGGLQATVDVHGCPPGTFAERPRRLDRRRRSLWAELDAETIHAGQFGLISSSAQA